MSDDPNISAEIWELIDAACNGIITPEELTILNDVMKDSPAVRQFYTEYCQFHTELSLMKGGKSAVNMVVQELSDHGKKVTLSSDSGNFASSRFFKIKDWSKNVIMHFRTNKVSLSVLTSFLFIICALSVMAWVNLSNNPDDLVKDGPQLKDDHLSVTPKLVARIARTHNCEWSDGRKFHKGFFLSEGEVIKLESGVAEIAFQSGAVFNMYGPAEFKFLSDCKGRLENGNIRVHVSEQAKKVAVITSVVDLFDIGTEFGVAADQTGTTNVHVFEGVVKAVSRNSEGVEREPVFIRKGQAFRFAPSKSDLPPKITSIVASHSSFPRTGVKLVTRWTFDGKLGIEDDASFGKIKDRLTTYHGCKIIEDSGSGRKGPSKVLQLTGNKDYASAIGNSPDLNRTGSFTIALWAKFSKPLGEQPPHASILMKRTTSEVRYNYNFSMNGSNAIPDVPGSHLRLSIFDKDTEKKSQLFYSWDGDPNQWHHYAWVFDSNEKKMKLYIDGNLKKTIPANATPKTNMQDLIVGKNPSYGNWDGWLDDICIYRDALSKDEVLELVKPQIK